MMTARLSLQSRLGRVAAIVVILAIFSAVVLSLGFGLSFERPIRSDLGADLISAALVFSGFALILIAGCIPVIVLPVILLGQRMGWLHDLHSTLLNAVPVGLLCALITTGWFLGREWYGQLIMIVLGAGCGLIGGTLWWRWIGAHEAAHAANMEPHA